MTFQLWTAWPCKTDCWWEWVHKGARPPQAATICSLSYSLLTPPHGALHHQWHSISSAGYIWLLSASFFSVQSLSIYFSLYWARAGRIDDMSQQQSAYLCTLKFRMNTGGFFQTHFCNTRISLSHAEYARKKHNQLCFVRGSCSLHQISAAPYESRRREQHRLHQEGKEKPRAYLKEWKAAICTQGCGLKRRPPCPNHWAHTSPCSRVIQLMDLWTHIVCNKAANILELEWNISHYSELTPIHAWLFCYSEKWRQKVQF